MRIFLAFWSALWTLFLPLILLYLRRRARKDALYGQHLGERFGRYPAPMTGAVWVHAVSLGELRSAVPLVRGLLDMGESVVITHFTPAGRRASHAAFGPEIAQGRVAAVWVPFELNWCFAGFFAAFRPKLGLVMEIEIWPRMVQAARDAGVALYMCNAQYPADSMTRDAKLPLRPAVMRRFAGAFVKSQLQADRFASVGLRRITVTGELRFDQPIPAQQLAASAALRAGLSAGQVVVFASVTQAEEALFVAAAQALMAANHRVLVVFVPRAPERFDAVAQLLTQGGLNVQRRSSALDENLRPRCDLSANVLLGDSLGEMYFYLGLAVSSPLGRVVVGGGFQPKGSHNITEALALGLPVLVGPHIQTIEYPAVEAIAAGVCKQTSSETLVQDICTWPRPEASTIAAFQSAHTGATAKTLAAIAPLLQPRITPSQ
jgi:3-deoxy-D-manno-octulosonic-acid transferase